MSQAQERMWFLHLFYLRHLSTGYSPWGVLSRSPFAPLATSESMLRGGWEAPRLQLRELRFPYPSRGLGTLIPPGKGKPHPVTGFLHLREQDGEHVGSVDHLGPGTTESAAACLACGHFDGPWQHCMAWKSWTMILACL